LTRAQAAIFKVEDEYEFDRSRVVPLADALIQYNYNWVADPPPKVIVHDRKQTRELTLDEGHDFRVLVPSPSGQRFVIFSDKGGDGWPAIPGGHAVEVARADLRTQVVITGTTGRTGGFLDPASFEDLPELDAIDYLGDDDTMVAVMGRTRANHLLLLRRDPASGEFAEVSRLKITKTETDLATTGHIVVTHGGKNIALYAVDGDRLIAMGTIDKPAKAGRLFSYPSDQRREIWFDDDGESYRLTNLEALGSAANLGTAATLGAPLPAAAKKTATAKKTPAAAKNKPAAAKNKPAAAKNKPAAAKNKPAAAKNKPAAAKNKPAAAKNKPAAAKNKPARG
jgi:hypothetical protein